MKKYSISGEGYLVDTDTNEKVTLYHGTTRKFAEHSPDKFRTELNSQYTGDWFCYSASKEVAWKYARAARNATIDRSAFLEEFKCLLLSHSQDAEERKAAGVTHKIIEGIVDLGYTQGWDLMGKAYSESQIPRFFDVMQTILNRVSDGVNINDYCDLCDLVEGTKSAEIDKLDMIMDFMSGMPNELPYGIKDEMSRLGFDTSVPEFRVLHSHIKGHKIFIGETQQQVKNAPMDCDIIIDVSETDKINGEPEFLMREPEQIEIYAYDYLSEQQEEVNLIEYVPTHQRLEKKSKALDYNETLEL